MMNGKKIPIAFIVEAFSFMKFTKPASVMTLPKTPPAAVIKSIGPAIFNDSFVIWSNSLIFLVSASKNTQKITPIARAMIGLPKNKNIFGKSAALSSMPCFAKTSITEPTAMKMIGMMIGARLKNPQGNLPNFFKSSS